MAWKDDRTIAAIQQYMRILTGLILFVLLVWMFAAQRIDFDTLMKVLLTTLTADRIGMAIVQARNSTPHS